MRRLGWILTYIISGTTFWIPSIVIHAIRGNEFGARASDQILVTLLPVITGVLALEVLSRFHIGPSGRPAIALWMLLGIWFLGPLCMMISARFSGGGFLSPETGQFLGLAIVLFVPYTFMMSGYDATTVALLIITLWFILVGAMGLTRRFRPIAKNDG